MFKGTCENMAEVKETWAEPTDRLLYVLRLKDECFYVGQSRADRFEGRIRAHFKGKGSAWTKAHLPVDVIEKIEVHGSYRDIELIENQKVIEYIKRYGLSKVRGGFFSNVDEEVTRKNLCHHGYSF